VPLFKVTKLVALVVKVLVAVEGLDAGAADVDRNVGAGEHAGIRVIVVRAGVQRQGEVGG